MPVCDVLINESRTGVRLWEQRRKIELTLRLTPPPFVAATNSPALKARI